MILPGSWMSEAISIMTRRQQLPLQDKEILLTFDDGPVSAGQLSSQLSALLSEREVQACFCVVGCLAAERMDLLHQLHEEGHTLANHSYTHRWLQTLRYEVLEEEIDRCDELLSSVSGRSVWARPPFGVALRRERLFFAHRHQKLVPVSFFAFDTEVKDERGADRLFAQMLTHIKRERGGALVLHEQAYNHRRGEEKEPRLWLVERLKAWVDTLQDEGYHFVSIESIRVQLP